MKINETTPWVAKREKVKITMKNGITQLTGRAKKIEGEDMIFEEENGVGFKTGTRFSTEDVLLVQDAK